MEDMVDLVGTEDTEGVAMEDMEVDTVSHFGLKLYLLHF